MDRTQRTARADKVLIDWRQNGTYKSIVAPYSLRAGPFPTAAMPLACEEVESACRRARPEILCFLAKDALERVLARGDLFAGARSMNQVLLQP